MPYWDGHAAVRQFDNSWRRDRLQDCTLRLGLFANLPVAVLPANQAQRDRISDAWKFGGLEGQQLLTNSSFRVVSATAGGQPRHRQVQTTA